MTLKLILKYHLFNTGDAKVPIEYKAEIAKELNEMVSTGNHNETNGANTLGQLIDVPEETKQ